MSRAARLKPEHSFATNSLRQKLREFVAKECDPPFPCQRPRVAHGARALTPTIALESTVRCCP